MNVLLARLALVGFGLAAALVLLEVGLRLAGYSYVAPHRTDRLLGLVLRPGAEGWSRQESPTYVRINSAGWRDIERQRQKPAGTFRIAVLGDSFAEAMQVRREDTFWSRAEARLNECPGLAGQRVEVLNFGVSTYGTAQQLLTLRHYVWDYQPDLVLLAFFSGNDVRDNSPALDTLKIRPYFVRRDGRLEVDDSFRQHPFFEKREEVPGELYYWSLHHFRTLQLLAEGRESLPEAIRDLRRGQLYDGVEFYEGPSSVAAGVLREPLDRHWAEAWELTEALLVQVRDEVEAGGARFLLVSLTFSPQVHPDRSFRERYAAALGVETLFYPEERLERLAARQSLPLLTLAQPLQERAERHGDFLHGFGRTLGLGHWNEAGHAAAGELIADRICTERLPAAGLP